MSTSSRGGPSCQATEPSASRRARSSGVKIWSSVRGYGSRTITRRRATRRPASTAAGSRPTPRTPPGTSAARCRRPRRACDRRPRGAPRGSGRRSKRARSVASGFSRKRLYPSSAGHSPSIPARTGWSGATTSAVNPSGRSTRSSQGSSLGREHRLDVGPPEPRAAVEALEAEVAARHREPASRLDPGADRREPVRRPAPVQPRVGVEEERVRADVREDHHVVGGQALDLEREALRRLVGGQVLDLDPARLERLAQVAEARVVGHARERVPALVVRRRAHPRLADDEHLHRRVSLRVGLEALLGALDRPVVVPAEERPQHRREHLEQRLVGVDRPVEADVRLAAVRRRHRPDAAAAQVALHVARDDARRLEPDDLRGRVQVVGEPPLEVLARDLADRGRPVGLDGLVHGLPPLRVGAGVRERVEHGLGRRGDVPLVHEHVLAAALVGDGHDRPRDRALDAGRRLRGVALVREVGHEPGRGERLQVAALRDLARGVELCEPLEQLGGPQGGAQLDADMALVRAVRVVAVRACRGNQDRLARAEHARLPAHRDAQGARDHLVPLGLVRVDVALRREAARAPDHLVVEQRAVGLGRGAEKHDPHAQGRDLEDVAGLRHPGDSKTLGRAGPARTGRRRPTPAEPRRKR